MDQQITFYGLPTQRITNGLIELDVLIGAGPRIVRLQRPGEPNLLAALPDRTWETPAGTFRLLGGHRLWHAPEAFPRTYQPDNEGLELTALPNGLRLFRPAEPATGIAKTLTITLAAGAPRATLVHELHNHGAWPIELAPWAITVLRPGGLAILPIGGPTEAGRLLPDRRIVLWPYTRIGDPRIQLHDDYILVHAGAGKPAKIGAFGRLGWAAYLLEGTLFVKRWTPQLGKPHPDDGCNLEAYFDHANLELETLAPLERLEPGATATHVEEWELIGGITTPPTIEGVREMASVHSLTV
jgi:hypothetical protein